MWQHKRKERGGTTQAQRSDNKERKKKRTHDGTLGTGDLFVASIEHVNFFVSPGDVAIVSWQRWEAVYSSQPYQRPQRRLNDW